MLLVEQGALHQQTVRTVQCAGVPAIFGLSEPAKDEVSLHRVQDLCTTQRCCCDMHLGTVFLLLLYDRRCLMQTISKVSEFVQCNLPFHLLMSQMCDTVPAFHSKVPVGP